MTNLVYPLEGAHGIEFYSRGGEPGAVTLDVWELKSAQRDAGVAASAIPSP